MRVLKVLKVAGLGGLEVAGLEGLEVAGLGGLEVAGLAGLRSLTKRRREKRKASLH